MRKSKRKYAGALAAVLLLLAGCMPGSREKTVLLPEKANTVKTESGETDEIGAVHKIYRRRVKDGTGRAPGIYPDQAHSFRYWTVQKEGEEEILAETVLDYRYGFHEERPLPLQTAELWKAGGFQQGLPLWGRKDCLLSPDGRYAVLAALSRSEMTLSLLDLQTGDSLLLLDGGRMGCSREEYRTAAGWSPDGKVLCYGFCPAELAGKDTDLAQKAVLYFRRLKTGERTSVSLSRRQESGEGGELKDVWLYGDWKGKEAKAALFYTLAEEAQDPSGPPLHVEWISLKDTGTGKERKIEAWPPLELRAETDCEKPPVYLDPEQDRIYAACKEAVLVYRASGEIEERLKLPRETQVLELLSADGGNTFLTVEREKAGTGKAADICLYRRNGDSLVRSVLYVGCGCVYQMTYDPLYRRLLVSAGETMDEEGIPADTWEGIVLEFQ